jgi:hypothetical protein
MNVLLGHHAGAAQLTLTLAWFLRQNVTTMGLGSFEPIGSGAKTLRGCPVGFQLRHVISSNLFSLLNPISFENGS